MSEARLGNFPLQRIGVRGGSMRSSQSPVANSGSNTSSELHSSVHDAGWLIARVWKFGEFSGLDAGTPIETEKLVRLEKRVQKLIGKVVVVQRLGGVGGGEADFIQIKRLIKIDRLENGSLGFWVEGDNKNASTDSRHWGYLKGSEIRGKVVFSRGIL